MFLFQSEVSSKNASDQREVNPYQNVNPSWLIVFADLTILDESLLSLQCDDSAFLINAEKLYCNPRLVGFFQQKITETASSSQVLSRALKIVVDDPFNIEFIWIKWVTEVVFRIDKKMFASTPDETNWRWVSLSSHGSLKLNEPNGLNFL
jgi:hypothetical protein